MLTVGKCFYLELIQSPQGNVCCARPFSRCWSGALCPFDRGVMLNVRGGAYEPWNCRTDSLTRFVRGDGHHDCSQSREHRPISRIIWIEIFLWIKLKSTTGKQLQKKWKRVEIPKVGFISVLEPLLMGSRTRCQPSLNWCLNRFNRFHALLDWLVMDLWRLDVRTCLVGPVKANAPSTSGFFVLVGNVLSNLREPISVIFRCPLLSCSSSISSRLFNADCRQNILSQRSSKVKLKIKQKEHEVVIFLGPIVFNSIDWGCFNKGKSFSDTSSLFGQQAWNFWWG